MTDAVSNFYQTLAQVAFTLLALWWLVVETRHAFWMSDPARRRTGFHLSLYFLLPGAMSLVSILATDVSVLWRVSFAIAGLLGAAESVMFAVRPDLARRLSRVAVAALPVVAGVYVLVVLLAIVPTLPRALGMGVSALHVEAVLLALLVTLGVTLAWFAFVGSAPAEAPAPAEAAASPPAEAPASKVGPGAAGDPSRPAG